MTKFQETQIKAVDWMQNKDFKTIFMAFIESIPPQPRQSFERNGYIISDSDGFKPTEKFLSFVLI